MFWKKIKKQLLVLKTSILIIIINKKISLSKYFIFNILLFFKKNLY